MLAAWKGIANDDRTLWGIPGTGKVPSPEKELKKMPLYKGQIGVSSAMVNKLAQQSRGGDEAVVLNRASFERSPTCLHQVWSTRSKLAYQRRPLSKP